MLGNANVHHFRRRAKPVDKLKLTKEDAVRL